MRRLTGGIHGERLLVNLSSILAIFFLLFPITQCVWDAGYVGTSYHIHLGLLLLLYSCYRGVSEPKTSPTSVKATAYSLLILQWASGVWGLHDSTSPSSLPSPAEGSTLGFLQKLMCWRNLHIQIPVGSSAGTNLLHEIQLLLSLLPVSDGPPMVIIKLTIHRPTYFW